MKKRIWELDALRGICIMGMVIVHLVYDLTSLYALVSWQIPEWFLFVQTWGSLFFFLISGICATLGRRSIKRGLMVIGGGMLCTLVTVGGFHLGVWDKGMIIWFGVLQCLGTCMLLWAPVRKLPAWALALIAVPIVACGMYLRGIAPVSYPWLIPLGITYPGFTTSDYFPLLPYFGFFLLGAVLGKTLYKKKESLLPRVDPQHPVLWLPMFFGKHSLLIYLLHQPLLAGVCTVLQMLMK